MSLLRLSAYSRNPTLLTISYVSSTITIVLAESSTIVPPVYSTIVFHRICSTTFIVCIKVVLKVLSINETIIEIKLCYYMNSDFTTCVPPYSFFTYGFFESDSYNDKV